MSDELIVRDSGVFARAELDIQITTAKAYPRDVKRVMNYATQLATMDEETAQSCFYVLPRTDKDKKKIEIKGPSIRLAEIMAAAWGNLHAATRIVENDGRHVTAEGVAWDLESNVKISMQNKVSIRFGGKDGKPEWTANADLQTTLSNAASAKALRNAIFKVIPKALVERVLEAAMKFSVGDQKTINAKVTEIFDKLIKIGLAKQDILDYYERKTMSEITAKDYQSLIGLGTAIKEGHIKIDEVFKEEKIIDDKKVSGADMIKNIISQKNESMQPEGKEELYKKIKHQIENAKSLDTLYLAADLIREVSDENKKELSQLFKQKESQLT